MHNRVPHIKGEKLFRLTPAKIVKDALRTFKNTKRIQYKRMSNKIEKENLGRYKRQFVKTLLKISNQNMYDLSPKMQ